MAAATLAPPASNTGILDGLPLSGHLNDALPVKLSPGAYWHLDLSPAVVDAMLQSVGSYGTAFVRLPYDDTPAEFVPLDKVYISYGQ